MINILVPEEIPSCNKGEAAIFAGMQETFRRLADETRVSIFSFDPSTDADRYSENVDIIDATGIMPSGIMYRSQGAIRKALDYLVFATKHSIFLLLYKVLRNKSTKLMKRDVWKAYCRANIIVMCHDSAFAPLYHCFLVHFFRLQNKRVVIYGATIAPSSTSDSLAKRLFYRYIISSALKRVELITLREQMSYDYVKKIVGSKSAVHLTGDLAFLLPPCPENRVREIMKREGIFNSNRIVGITVSRNRVKFAFPDIKDYSAKEKKFIAIMGIVVDYLTEVLQALVVFVPHSVVEDEERDDRVLAQKILEVVQNSSKVKVIMNEYAPEELKGLTGKFEFSLGTRLHFIVDSCSMSVPSIMITNNEDYRAYGIFGEMLDQKKWIHDIRSLNPDQLIAKIDEGWMVRKTIKSELMRIIPMVKHQAAQNGVLLNKLIMRSNLRKPFG